MAKRLLQIFSLCLPLAALLAMLTVSAGAVIASGTWEDVTWSISDSGQLTIGCTSGVLSGQKPLPDGVTPSSDNYITTITNGTGESKSFLNGGWKKYAKQITSIVVQNGVTHIVWANKS